MECLIGLFQWSNAPTMAQHQQSYEYTTEYLIIFTSLAPKCKMLAYCIADPSTSRGILCNLDGDQSLVPYTEPGAGLSSLIMMETNISPQALTDLPTIACRTYMGLCLIAMERVPLVPLGGIRSKPLRSSSKTAKGNPKHHHQSTHTREQAIKV